MPRLQGQRRGGSARWVEKEDVLAMRWAWVDQGTGRPIGGPCHAFGVDVPQAQQWAHHTKSLWCPLMEQETEEVGPIRNVSLYASERLSHGEPGKIVQGQSWSPTGLARCDRPG